MPLATQIFISYLAPREIRQLLVYNPQLRLGPLLNLVRGLSAEALQQISQVQADLITSNNDVSPTCEHLWLPTNTFNNPHC